MTSQQANPPSGTAEPPSPTRCAGPTDFRGNPLRGSSDLALQLGVGTPDFSAHRILNTTLCLRDARAFTAHLLHRWHLETIQNDVIQVVSELVANAMRHGLRPPAPHPDVPVWLALARRPRALLCVVADPSLQPPSQQAPSALAENHRGLLIVAALSEAWGWTSSNAAGKSVWARIPTPARSTPKP